MKFLKEDLKELTWGNEPEGFKLVHTNDWTQDHKYQPTSWIFEFENKLYGFNDYRSGSYHTDWYYSSDDWENEVDCKEFEEYEVTTKKYREKK